jgi:tripartite-type tricarboxylate transporter receptor subunit TctC
VKTVKDLVSLAKAKPGQLQFASPGAGSVQHLAGELFKLKPSLVDLIAGHVHLDFDSVPPVLPHVKTGRLRAIAVTSEKRYALLPEIPTVSESGLPGFDMSTWWGLLVPAAGNSKQVVPRLHAETVKILRMPDVKERMAAVGAETVGNSPEEFAAFMRTERAKYAKIVKDANIKLD